MKFSPKQLSFLKEMYVARIATRSPDGALNVSPIYFANDAHSIFFATEYTSRKFKNLSLVPEAALSIDYFDASWLHTGKYNAGKIKRNDDLWTVERALIVRGRARIFKDGQSTGYRRMYRLLFDKYPDYRKQKWKRGESPIIRISARSISSWGI